MRHLWIEAEDDTILDLKKACSIGINCFTNTVCACFAGDEFRYVIKRFENKEDAVQYLRELYQTLKEN